MLKHLVLYSINTLLAYRISEYYYKGLHYVWCSPCFDCTRNSSIEAINPPSSNPAEIYFTIKSDIERRDKHSEKISNNRLGIIKGAAFKRSQGLISEVQEKEIISITGAADFSDFQPLIYVIPMHNIINIAKEVSFGMKAAFFSEEYIIEELPRKFFDIIDLNGRV